MLEKYSLVKELFEVYYYYKANFALSLGDGIILSVQICICSDWGHESRLL